MTEIIQAPSGATTPLPTVTRRTAVPTSPPTVSGPAGSGAGTVLPLADRASGPDRGPEERRVNGMRISDLLCHVGAALASLAVTVVVFTELAPVSGPIAFAAVAYVLFLVFYALLVATTENAAVVRDRVVSAAIHTLAFVVVATLVFVVGFSVVRATKALPHANFITQDMALTGPLDPMTSGGVLHAIAGSLIQISIALLITVPLGITTALFLTEVPGPFARFVRTIVEAMTALPSIVAGLFVYASVIVGLGVDKSGFAASLAISVMMLPIMIRSADVVLRLVPATLKEASIGLGAGQWQTVWRVVLPTSRSGLVTAIILATARGIGETSPVLLTAGYAPDLNIDPTNGPMISLPLAIFEFVKSPEPNMIARGFGAAAVLMTLVLVLFVIARVIGAQTVATRERRNERFRAAGRLLRRGVEAAVPAARSARRFVDHHVDRLNSRLTDSSPKDPS
ncbi:MULTISPECIES: phosphate ABC transporter permease PstA [unclassified Curtobacterium]|uniref:phosphate ABC transporter permease PstA n=1 Tax=unclassified Curtobacterium TaxID=257496 RepID=UPI001C652AF3|nr:MULTISPECIES: phosphate ABC transporter permease PstA [unclassified Curtobacterium]WIB25772.1 phosphate ABC transporter permease PstA [Curtobacterium sp. MCSS17_015]